MAKIKNLNVRKWLGIGGVATVVSMACLFGPKVYEKQTANTSFTYTVDEDNNIKAEGKVKYNIVKDWSLVEIELITGDHKLFIIKRYGVYTNVLTDMNISNSPNSIKKRNALREYLIAYDFVKAYYTEDDIEALLELIEKDYQYSNNEGNNKVLEK